MASVNLGTESQQLFYGKLKQKSAQVLVQSPSITKVLFSGLLTSEEKLMFQEVLVSTMVMT